MTTFADWLRWYAAGIPASGPKRGHWRRIFREMARHASPQLVTLDFVDGEPVLTIVEPVA